MPLTWAGPVQVVLVQLRTMQHAAHRDRPWMRAALRERLQTYVDQVMALADESGGSRVDSI